MPTANLFGFDKRTGQLYADENACQDSLYTGINAIGSLVDLVSQTIDALNLNCQRLCDARIKVMHEYNRQIKTARIASDNAIHKKLAERWFSAPLPAFYTTRRILLGSAAEEHLKGWS